ncbi:hypothetical protein AGLY_008520, partial [Aphis glycines]
LFDVEELLLAVKWSQHLELFFQESNNIKSILLYYFEILDIFQLNYFAYLGMSEAFFVVLFLNKHSLLFNSSSDSIRLLFFRLTSSFEQFDSLNHEFHFYFFHNPVSVSPFPFFLITCDFSPISFKNVSIFFEDEIFYFHYSLKLPPSKYFFALVLQNVVQKLLIDSSVLSLPHLWFSPIFLFGLLWFQVLYELPFYFLPNLIM